LNLSTTLIRCSDVLGGRRDHAARGWIVAAMVSPASIRAFSRLSLRCRLSQNSGVVPKVRARRRAVSPVMARRPAYGAATWRPMDRRLLGGVVAGLADGMALPETPQPNFGHPLGTLEPSTSRAWMSEFE